MSHSKPKNDLLFEIGLEELPSKSLQALSESLLENIQSGFAAALLPFDDIKSFVTPRRLSVVMTGIIPLQPSRTVVKRGPAKNASFDANGQLMFSTPRQQLTSTPGHQYDYDSNGNLTHSKIDYPSETKHETFSDTAAGVRGEYDVVYKSYTVETSSQYNDAGQETFRTTTFKFADGSSKTFTDPQMRTYDSSGNLATAHGTTIPVDSSGGIDWAKCGQLAMNNKSLITGLIGAVAGGRHADAGRLGVGVEGVAAEPARGGPDPERAVGAGLRVAQGALVPAGHDRWLPSGA